MLIAVSTLSPVNTHTFTPAAFTSAIVSTTSSCSLKSNSKPNNQKDMVNKYKERESVGTPRLEREKREEPRSENKKRHHKVYKYERTTKER